MVGQVHSRLPSSLPTLADACAISPGSHVGELCFNSAALPAKLPQSADHTASPGFEIRYPTSFQGRHGIATPSERLETTEAVPESGH